jgi:hypothetical protein
MRPNTWDILIEMREVNDGDMVRTQDLCSDTMLNHHLSQKLKLIGRGKFNHLINTLTLWSRQHHRILFNKLAGKQA